VGARCVARLDKSIMGTSIFQSSADLGGCFNWAHALSMHFWPKPLFANQEF